MFTGNEMCVNTGDDPQEVLHVQLQEFRELVVDANEGSKSMVDTVPHTHIHRDTKTHAHLLFCSV